MEYLQANDERTRNKDHLALGISPRGSKALYRAPQALAFVEGLDYCTPNHVKRLVITVFSHLKTPIYRDGGRNRPADRSAEILGELLHAPPEPLRSIPKLESEPRP
jgi:MoxR-like ATPase